MQLPIDVVALFEEATDIEAAGEIPLSVSVYIDDAAPAGLVAHVRNAFASTLPSVRMTVSYLDSGFCPNIDDDVAVVVAGPSRKIGASAAAIRAVGVPAMVVTTSPAALAKATAAGKHAIPDGDIVAPYDMGEAEEPFELNDEAAAALDERMGRWIVSVRHEKRLAFAIAFPFMRRALAADAVQATALQNAVVGFIPFIPGADLPIMTLNQAKMVMQIAAAYGREISAERIKELAVVVIGAYLSRGLVRKLVGAVPVLGFLIKPGVAFGTTSAVGYAIIEYYEGGEDVTGVANVIERATESGTKLVGDAQHAIPKLAGALENAPEVIASAREKIPAVVQSLVRAK